MEQNEVPEDSEGPSAFFPVPYTGVITQCETWQEWWNEWIEQQN